MKSSKVDHKSSDLIKEEKSGKDAEKDIREHRSSDRIKEEISAKDFDKKADKEISQTKQIDEKK